jgi:hypothetical protein
MAAQELHVPSDWFHFCLAIGHVFGFGCHELVADPALDGKMSAPHCIVTLHEATKQWCECYYHVPLSPRLYADTAPCVARFQIPSAFLTLRKRAMLLIPPADPFASTHLQRSHHGSEQSNPNS